MYVINSAVAVSILLSLSVTFCASGASGELDELSSCFTNSINGEERKRLVVWVYLGISTHSSLKRYSNITPKDIDESNKFVGRLITRLLSKDCIKEVGRAEASGEYESFSHAFHTLGDVAVQEVLLEPETRTALEGFKEYLGD